jgi:hypothetical protein
MEASLFLLLGLFWEDGSDWSTAKGAIHSFRHLIYFFLACHGCGVVLGP